MTKRERELLKRIEQLERKVKELEARPATQFHYHYAQPTPYYIPTYVPAPSYPWNPTYPIWATGTTTTVAAYDANVPHTLTAN